MKLRLGIPKGSLQEATLKLFKKAGYNISLSSRSYFPYIDDPDIEPILLRAQEIPRYVESGALDCGITGEDWIRENSSKVETIKILLYAKQGLGKVKWVLAVPDNSRIKRAQDLKGKHIATEIVNVTQAYLKRKGIKAEVEFSWGATEAKVAWGLVDAVVELTETGASLRANNLRIIDTICESATKLIANQKSLKDAQKKCKIDEIGLLLESAILSEKMVGLKMNVRELNLDKVLRALPALKKPTVSCLSQKGWLALETVVSEEAVRSLVPKLKKAGASGIIEYALNKVIE